MKYIIDTNILIDHLRGDNKAASFLLDVETGRKQAAISVVTEYEILVGIRDAAEEAKITALLSLMPILTVTSPIVRQAAHFRRAYRADIVLPQPITPEPFS